MVCKQCLACGGYFRGELDGAYLCPACAHASATSGQVPVRALSNLDLDTSGAPSLRKRADTPNASERDLFAKSQAA